MSEEGFVIRTLPIDSTSWTPVIPPIDCLVIILRNDAGDTKIRTIASDSSTEDTFVAGVQMVPGYAAPAPKLSTASHGYRFAKGREEFYLQAAAGSPDVKIYFVP